MIPFFLLDGKMYCTEDIKFLELNGGPYRCGCWGKIQLKDWPEPKVIGDGSYANSPSHVPHLVAGGGDIWHFDFGFKVLRAIMREAGEPPAVEGEAKDNERDK